MTRSAREKHGAGAIVGAVRPNQISEDPKRYLRSPRRKYGNVPKVVDGITFDSTKEAERYGHLRMLEQAGVIRDLFVHEAFPFVVHGESCGSYVSDFTYLTETGERIVEDVKSAVTRKLPTYRLKVRLLWALYGLRVREV